MSYMITITKILPFVLPNIDYTYAIYVDEINDPSAD
jgi:hypothetical protein